MESYLGEKRFTGKQLLQTGIMMSLSILLIYGGLTIIEDENIFKKIYEGYVTSITVTDPPVSGICSSGNTLYSVAGNTLKKCITNCSSSEILAYSDGSRVIGTTLEGPKLTLGTATSGLQCVASSSSGSGPLAWTATLPDGLTLSSLQKNISSLRNKSNTNITIGYTLIVTGSLVIAYQGYTLFA